MISVSHSSQPDQIRDWGEWVSHNCGGMLLRRSKLRAGEAEDYWLETVKVSVSL